MKHPGVFFKEMFSLLLKKALAYYSERGGVVNAAITGLASGLAGLFFSFLDLPPYTLAGFDLTTHSSSLLGGRRRRYH
jgi:hypothetical protein